MSGGRALRDEREVVLFRTIQEASWAQGVAMLDSDVIAFRDALLPVMEAECRRRAAEELRAAAAEAHDEYSGWEAARVVTARADALEGCTDMAADCGGCWVAYGLDHSQHWSTTVFADELAARRYAMDNYLTAGFLPWGQSLDKVTDAIEGRP